MRLPAPLSVELSRRLSFAVVHFIHLKWRLGFGSARLGVLTLDGGVSVRVPRAGRWIRRTAAAAAAPGPDSDRLAEGRRGLASTRPPTPCRPSVNVASCCLFAAGACSPLPPRVQAGGHRLPAARRRFLSCRRHILKKRHWISVTALHSRSGNFADQLRHSTGRN